MKKILVALLLLIISVGVSAQVPLREQSMGGSPVTLNTVPGGLWGKLYLILPKKDTLNNAAVGYVGAVTIRPQDTLLTDYPPIYMSNGRFWFVISGGSGQGIDSITVSTDSTLYQAYNQGNQVFTFSTLLRHVKAGANVYFTRDVDTLVVNSVTGGTANGLVSVGGLVLSDSTLYVQHDIVWRISNVLYTRTTDTFYVIPSADSNYYRKDVIYIDSADGSFNYLQGTQDTVVAYPPVVPQGGIIVTIVDVFGPTITQPVPFVVSGFWSTTGNTGTNSTTNYVGTSDSVDLNISTKGIPRILIKADGSLTTVTSDANIRNMRVGRGVTSRGGDSLNVAVGKSAIDANTTGYWNTAVGDSALKSNTTGRSNVAIGYRALSANTTGLNNVAVGRGALTNNTTGFFNIAIGPDALPVNSTGTSNIGIGSSSLFSLTTGTLNIGIGPTALNNNLTGGRNIAIGSQALGTITNSSFNVGIGVSALSGTTTGGSNVAIGHSAGSENTTGARNIFIGFNAGVRNTTDSNKIYINSLPRGATLTKDTNYSPIYVVQADSLENQIIKLNGVLKIRHGATNGYVLTSDANGLATWQAPSGGGGGGTNEKEEFTGSTSSTVTVANAYTAGSVDVYKNGVLLMASLYTEAGGSNITLTEARLVGDVIIVKYRH